MSAHDLINRADLSISSKPPTEISDWRKFASLFSRKTLTLHCFRGGKQGGVRTRHGSNRQWDCATSDVRNPIRIHQDRQSECCRRDGSTQDGSQDEQLLNFTHSIRILQMPSNRLEFIAEHGPMGQGRPETHPIPGSDPRFGANR